MKCLAGLLALCQDLGVDINPPKIIFKKETEERIFGNQIKIKDILFGELGEDAEKMSFIVNNLYLQVDNSQFDFSTFSGAKESEKMSIVREIAEVYEEMLCFLLNKEINPERGYIIFKGKVYKFPKEEIFLENHKKKVFSIREKHKNL